MIKKWGRKKYDDNLLLAVQKIVEYESQIFRNKNFKLHSNDAFFITENH